ncbi:MAG: type II toxin-antitoxin system HipA family toxin, partial [Alistipes sp.]
LSILLDACESYMLTGDVATQIILNVAIAVKDWKVLATKLGIANSEMERFGSTFNDRIKDFV